MKKTPAKGRNCFRRLLSAPFSWHVRWNRSVLVSFPLKSAEAWTGFAVCCCVAMPMCWCEPPASPEPAGWNKGLISLPELPEPVTPAGWARCFPRAGQRPGWCWGFAVQEGQPACSGGWKLSVLGQGLQARERGRFLLRSLPVIFCYLSSSFKSSTRHLLFHFKEDKCEGSQDLHGCQQAVLCFPSTLLKELT